MDHAIARNVFIRIARIVLLIFFFFPVQWGLAEQSNQLKAGVSGHSFLSPSYGSTWQIDAAKLTYDQNRNTYEAEGNVRIWSGDRSIQADWAKLDTEKQEVELKGNILLQYGKDWLRGNHVVWNIEKEVGWVDEGLIYFAENHFYAKGAYIAKTGRTEYELKEGFLTSCDPEKSDWKIKYKELSMRLNGVATASSTSFWVRDLPVFYSPFLTLPVQLERQSGFLIPWGGYSELNGFQGELPFYWAIRPDMDVTLYGRYMTERGWMSGLEYRISNAKWGEGIWIFNYLDDQASKEHLEAQGFPYQTDDRYWVRGRHTAELPYEIEARVDLDYVSDRNFLREFQKGSSSLDYSNSLFRDYMGRGILNDEYTLVRESALNLDRRFESALVTMDSRYWEQLDESSDERTLQRLPSLSFSVIPSWIDHLPVYYTIGSSLVNYWRSEGDEGSRLALEPRAYYPIKWKNYLDIEPSVGLNSQSYWVDWQEDSHDTYQGRLTSDVRLALSSRVNRVYDFNMGDYVALQHAIRPEVVYEYVPEGIEDTFPHFDRFDEDPARHDIRYGFSTFLTAKEVRNNPAGDPVTSYREIARLQLFEAYNIEPSPADFPDIRLDSRREEGFSDIGMRLDVMPKRYLTLSYDTDFSHENAGTTRQDVFMTVDSGRGHMFRLDYEFRRDSFVDEIIPQLNLKILPNIYLSTYHDYSLAQEELYAQGYGIRYQSGCWAVGVVYEREDNDQRVAVSLNLLGMGTLKGSQVFRSDGFLTSSP